jgi:hypothetical protein
LSHSASVDASPASQEGCSIGQSPWNRLSGLWLEESIQGIPGIAELVGHRTSASAPNGLLLSDPWLEGSTQGVSKTARVEDYRTSVSSGVERNEEKTDDNVFSGVASVQKEEPLSWLEGTEAEKHEEGLAEEVGLIKVASDPPILFWIY